MRLVCHEIPVGLFLFVFALRRSGLSLCPTDGVLFFRAIFRAERPNKPQPSRAINQAGTYMKSNAFLAQAIAHPANRLDFDSRVRDLFANSSDVVHRTGLDLGIQFPYSKKQVVPCLDSSFRLRK